MRCPYCATELPALAAHTKGEIALHVVTHPEALVAAKAAGERARDTAYPAFYQAVADGFMSELCGAGLAARVAATITPPEEQ